MLIEKFLVKDDERALLKVGEEEIMEIDLASLEDNDKLVRQLPWSMIEKLGKAYGVEIGKGQPPHALKLAVRYCVQDDWYMATRGEIPMTVQNKHADVKGQIAKEPAGGASKTATGGETKAPRQQRLPKTPSRWALAQDMDDRAKEKFSKLRGQAKRVTDGLSAAHADGKANVDSGELATYILKTGPYAVKNDDVAGSATYHLKGLKNLGIVVEIEQPAAAAAV